MVPRGKRARSELKARKAKSALLAGTEMTDQKAKRARSELLEIPD